MNRAILTACKLEDLWKNGSYKNRQNIQYLVFPDGLIWDKESGKPRTIHENEALLLMRLISSTYKTTGNKKTGKSFDLSGLVDYGEKISNLIQDLNHLYSFAIEML